MGNGQAAHYVSFSSQAAPFAAGTGNGTRILFMPPEIVTAHDADKPVADDPVKAQPQVASDLADKDTSTPDTGAKAALPKPARAETWDDASTQRSEEADKEARQQDDAKEEAPAEEEEVIELDTGTTAPSGKTVHGGATQGVDRGDGGGDVPNPRVIVQRWQAGVSSSSAALPRRNMSALAGGPGKITSAADKANADRRAKTSNVAADAAANIQAPPKVPEPPPAPRSNPIPNFTAAIEAASGKTLPHAFLPELSKSAEIEVVPGLRVGGNMPTIGDRAVRDKWVQLLSTEGAEALAQIPEDKNNPERKALEDARAALAKPIKEEPARAIGPPSPLIDKGPLGIAPLPPVQGTPVANVVARLLASSDSATADVLVRLRRLVYPRGENTKYFPNIGSALSGTLGPRMNSELREIATAAGVSGAELDQMVATRKTELEKEAADINKAITASHEKATQGVSETGQEALDQIEGARQLTDEEIIKRQEAATGGSDPEVINARRDLVIRWVRAHVNRQTTNYQKAGEKREKELGSAQTDRVEALNALAQREQYQGLNPAPPAAPHDRSKPEIVRKLADFAAALQAAAREAVQTVRTAMRPLFKTARDTTRENRAAVEIAGNDAIDAANLWAEDRILEGQSWWDRFKAKLGRWFGDAQKSNEQWSVNRTEETRNGINADLGSVAAVQQSVANGATKEQLLQSQGLTEDQRAVVTEYFAQPAGAHQLDIAAGALRQRLARQYVDVARPAFDAELLAQPDGSLDNVAEMAKSMRPTFDGPKIVMEVHAQLDNFDSDESAMLRSLEGLSAFEGTLVRRMYRAKHGIDMDLAMTQAFDSDEMDQAELRLAGKGAAADAAALDYAFGIIDTDEKAIMDLLRGRSQEEIEQISAEYKRRYGKELNKALLDNLDEGNEQEQAKALIAGDKEAAAAIEIDEAMRGGFMGWGTKEEDIEATYKRVHADVLAQAQREGWGAEQMKAEVRRRSALIEAKFNKRYENVEEYNEPGLAGTSVLRRAFSSEMDPGPERDLANALADSDMVKADAARIEIERQGVWASDEAINKVLTNQYENALQDTRLDQGPARKMRVDRYRNEILKQDPQITEQELSIKIMAFERVMEREIGAEAHLRSNISMEVLNDAYQKRYFYPLSYTIEANMSGADLEKARDLHKQGGRLDAFQEVDYATKGDGTDEQALRTRIGSMTKSEIDELDKQWKAKHKDQSLRQLLADELSGRDASDILDMYDHGAPESAKARIDQEQRRVKRELGELTGVLGGAAAGREADWLTVQMGRLNELKSDLDRRDLSDDERELLRERLDYRVELVQQGVEDHRRAIDSVANLAAQVASMVVAVALGSALTFFSGGALGPVVIAVIASVAATITTMGTKALVQGGSYGVEDMGVDLAVGVVDAITSAATAGMGGKLLRGATGAGEQAAARVAQPNRLMRLVGKAGGSDIMQSVAKSRAGQVAGKVASNLNKMESGFLTRGIKGTNILARMAKGDSKALRILAEGLAEGIENAVSALPSSFAGTALNDKTWEGNPLLNLAAGTYEGVKGAVQMGALMQGAGAAYGAARSHVRLSTPEGRLTEANRILNDARAQHRATNPDAPPHEVMNSPEMKRAQAEVESRGLVGEQRQLAAAAETASRGEAGTHPDTAIDPATQALRDGLPKTLTERVDVSVNTDLDSNSVHVIPDPRGPGHGVRVEVGPRATPTDVLLHAHTIQSMRRYQGLLGKLRQAKDWFNLTSVGSNGWEAKLELEKLPGIIHERMQRLGDSTLSPEAHADLVSEINHLSAKIDEYQHVLDTPELREQPGRGYVANTGRPDRPLIEGVATTAPERSPKGMREHALTLVDNGPLASKDTKVYQIGHEWQERGYYYRRVVVHDADNLIAVVHEETRSFDKATGKHEKRWVIRGSELSGKHGSGKVGEAASRMTVEKGAFGGMMTLEGKVDVKARQAAAGTRRAQINESALHNASDNGFDGVFLRINADGTATVVIVEAKNQPSGLSLESFTAVRGDGFKKNLRDLRERLNSATADELGISAKDQALALQALTQKSPNVEIQIHTTPDTPLGHRDHPGSSIIKDLEISVQGKDAGNVKVVHVPMNATVTDRARTSVRKEARRRDNIGKPSVRLEQLAGEGARANSPEHRRAEAMLRAEGSFTNGVVSPHPKGKGQFVDSSGVLFEVLTPGALGNQPTAQAVAAKIVKQLYAPAPVGATGQRKIILEMSHLDPATRDEVLKLLREDAKVGKRAKNILIHDRANGAMTFLKPEDNP